MELVTVSTIVNTAIDKVWEYWTVSEHVKKWNNASPEWHTPYAENDFIENGAFLYRMEAVDKSFGFDFSGKYSKIIKHKEIAYTINDGRKVIVLFDEKEGKTHITERFEAENSNPVELQEQGWQAILDNFKKYTESH